jgi:hypothetical protein
MNNSNTYEQVAEAILNEMSEWMKRKTDYSDWVEVRSQIIVDFGWDISEFNNACEMRLRLVEEELSAKLKLLIEEEKLPANLKQLIDDKSNH